MRSRLQLSAALLCAGLVIGTLWAWRAPTAEPPLENWDRCAAGAGEPVNRVAMFAARPGTVQLGDAGCEWLTGASDGGAFTARRHKIFGTLNGGPDVRVIAERVTSMVASFEWHDDDGDGHRDMEKRVTFGPLGEEERIEQFDWNDAGIPHGRSVIAQVSPQLRHILEERFVDGGWLTTSESDVPYMCEHYPIVPIRPVK